MCRACTAGASVVLARRGMHDPPGLAASACGDLQPVLHAVLTGDSPGDHRGALVGCGRRGVRGGRREPPMVRLASATIVFALLALVASASDGVLEINQTCAAVGCFQGDSAGFPVTINSAGSY